MVLFLVERINKTNNDEKIFHISHHNYGTNVIIITMKQDNLITLQYIKDYIQINIKKMAQYKEYEYYYNNQQYKSKIFNEYGIINDEIINKDVYNKKIKFIQENILNPLNIMSWKEWYNNLPFISCQQYIQPLQYL